MITPKPATVFELFNGHPERWIKHFISLDDRWTIDGAIEFIYGENAFESDAAKLAIWQTIPDETIAAFNNSTSTTFDMMLAKVKEAGI